MENSGIFRRVDELGRIVLPIEMRRNLEIEERDLLEISQEGERIVLKKAHRVCIFCGSAEELSDYRNKRICRECLLELAELEA